MFRFIAQMFDESLDAILAPVEGKPYGQVMGRIGLVMAASAVVVLAALLAGVKGREIRTPAYFIVQEDKAPARLPVLNNPSLSVEKISNWSARALRDIFRFEFGRVDAQLASSEVYFLPQAWSDFQASMQKTEMLDRIRSERLFVVLTPLEEPQLVGRGVVGGREVIRVEAPVVLTYIGGETPVYQYQIIELFVRSVPPTESPEGLAIARLRAHPYRQ